MEEKCSVEKKKKTKLPTLKKIAQILAIHQQKVAQTLAKVRQRVVPILQNPRIVPTATNFHPK